ncbi:MAG TPA: hypothetical protein VIK39_13875, partial [Candidatus Angelobacter sp.]
WGNQAVILMALGGLDEAMTLLKQQESICNELNMKYPLAYCYWNWGRLAGGLGNAKTQKEKLKAALALFTELKMPRERDAVQAELHKMGFLG